MIPDATCSLDVREETIDDVAVSAWAPQWWSLQDGTQARPERGRREVFPDPTSPRRLGAPPLFKNADKRRFSFLTLNMHKIHFRPVWQPILTPYDSYPPGKIWRVSNQWRSQREGLGGSNPLH